MAPSIDDFADLYRERFHRFLRVAEAITGNLDSARDAVQEGFSRAVQHRSGYRGEGSLESWVWTCVVNASRGEKLRKEVPVADPRDHVDDSALELAEGGFATVLSALPDRQRLVLFLRYYADLDYRGIAAALNIEIGTVAASLNKGHAALRRSLEDVPG